MYCFTFACPDLLALVPLLSEADTAAAFGDGPDGTGDGVGVGDSMAKTTAAEDREQTKESE